MRPEDFSPGNTVTVFVVSMPAGYASMRPEDFSPGNYCSMEENMIERSGFNEAGGFLPRKPEAGLRFVHLVQSASMRPEDFSPGNESLPYYDGPVEMSLQ